MNTVENRIVHMTFDNKKFEHDIAVTIASIEKLKTTLDFTKTQASFKNMSDLKMNVDTTAFQRNIAEALGNVKQLRDGLDFSASQSSFNRFSEVAKGFNLNSMVGAIDGVSKKFLALSTIGITALATLTSHAITAGLQTVKAFTVGPIIDGFREMETNMNSIQTILANTQSKGSTLEDVNEALQQLNEYSDKTIYNFSQMAKNIGTFTAAGVDLDTSVGAIKGIANLAAISGSNAEQASTAMYQLSQALSAGKVRMIDWISVRNAGLGGEVFKTALFETGKALGKLGDVPMKQTFTEWTDAGNSFEESLKDDWLTADVLTTTLQAFTGDLTNAQLMALGYTKEQATEMERLGKLGVASATEVKTLTALLGTLKESVATGWADSFKLVVGDFNEAKELFTDLNNTIGGFVQDNAKARNKILGDWKALGGRNVVIAGIKNAFDALGFVVKQVKTVFKDLFPEMTGRRLFELSVEFRDFTAHIEQFVQRHGQDFRDILEGIKSAIEIVIEVVKQAIDSVKDLFDYFGGGMGSQDVLDFFVNIADKVKEWKEQLVDEGGIAAFFDKIVEIIKDPGKYIDILKDKILDLKGAFVDFFKDIDFGSIDGLVDGFGTIRDKVQELLSSIAIDLHLPQGVIDFFSSMGDNIDANTTNSLAGGFDRLRDALSTLWDIAKKVWDVFTSIGDALQWAWEKFTQFSGFVIDAIQAVFTFLKELGPKLQDAIKSEEFDRILDLMDSIALLLGAKGLSNLGTSGLKITGDLSSSGLTGLVEGLRSSTGIVGAVKSNLDALTGTLKAMTTQIKANALLKIAEAMLILTGAVLVLSMINPDSLAKSLGALAVGMGQLIGALALLNVMTSGPKGSAQMAGLTLGLNLMASAILILTGAVAVLAQFSVEELARGMLALEGLVMTLVVISDALQTSGPGLVLGGAGMIAISTALVILGGALKIYATMSWEEIGKAMTVLTGSLLILGAAMGELSLKAPITAPAMIAIAASLLILGAAFKIFATLSWEDIGKSLVVLLGSLLIITAAMSEMSLKAPITAPALIAVATALVILGGALKIFASMSWEEIGKSMVVLFGSLLILDAALSSMTGAIPGAIAIGIVAAGLIILGIAIKGFAAISWGDFAKGLGMVAISFLALGVSAQLLQPVLPALFGLAAALALLGVGFALIGIGAGLLAEAFQIVATAGTMGIDVFMYAIDQLLTRIPALVSGFVDGLILMVQQMLDALPALIESLVKVIAALIDGLIELTPKFVELAKEWIGALLEVIIAKTPDIIKLGLGLILALLKGIRDHIKDIVAAGVDIITNLLKGLTQSIPKFIGAVVGLITTLLKSIADHIDEIVAAGLEIITSLALGITNNISEIVGAVTDIITTFIDEISDSAQDIIDAGVDMIIDFVEGLGEDSWRITDAAIETVKTFLSSLVDETIDFANYMADLLIELLDGLTEAINTHETEIADSAHALIFAIINAMVDILGLKEVADAMWELGKKIGKSIFKGFTDFLHITSPSKVFMEAAKEIPRGIAEGLDDDVSAERSAANLAKRTYTAFQEIVDQVALGMQVSDEFNPTITPVLDLTSVQAQASQLGNILGQTPLQTGVSLDAATALSAETAQSRENETVPSEGQTAREVKFEQNNYSPESLNTAKIYRQTRNLIVLTKEELEVT